MRKLKFVAIALAAIIAVLPLRANAGVIITPPAAAAGGASGGATYGLIGCVAGIMIAAIVASQEFNRELTTEEAATCGLLFWINRANAQQ